MAPDISVTRNFLYFESCLPQIYSVKKSLDLLSNLGTNYQPVTKLILSEAFLVVYRPHVTLKELCSCGNLSENKLQNRGRYLFWRNFFDFVLKNISLKGESRCNILDTSSIFSRNRVAMNLLCVKLETTWGPFVVFGRFLSGPKQWPL